MGYTKWSTAKQIKAMRDFNELEFKKSGCSESPTQEDYDYIKKHYDIEVPAPLKKLLAFSNGGRLKINEFPSTNSAFRGNMIVSPFYYLKVGNKALYGMIQELHGWRPYIGRKGLPFAQDPGGDLFFLDTSKEPAVVKYVMHDFDMKVITIAKDFETFIDGLIADNWNEDDLDDDKEVNYLYDGDAEEDILDDEDDYDDEEDDDSSEEEKKP